MKYGTIKLNPKLIFILAIKEQEKQVEMITQLIRLIQTGSLLEKLTMQSDPLTCLILIRSAVQLKQLFYLHPLGGNEIIPSIKSFFRKLYFTQGTTDLSKY